MAQTASSPLFCDPSVVGTFYSLKLEICWEIEIWKLEFPEGWYEERDMQFWIRQETDQSNG
jgi:hypothetical protein